MAYTDLTDTFEYKLRIRNTELTQLSFNDDALITFLPFNSRPQLRYLSATEVQATQNNNNFFQDLWDVMFPDGTQITGQSNLSGNSLIFDITRTASWVFGDPHQGGLRSGLSESTNTWYAIYAVKVFSGATPVAAVMVGDTTLPFQANVVTLNTRYGQNNWVYMGMIRNGDQWSNLTDIVPFISARNKTFFTNTGRGIQLAVASAASVTWAYSAGVSGAVIPAHLKIGKIIFRTNADTGKLTVMDFGSARNLLKSGTLRMIDSLWAGLLDGFRIDGTSATSKDIHLVGFADNVLGLGYSPQI